MKKWGTPYFGGISGENSVQSWPPRESKPAEKTAHHPSGAISEVLPRVDLGHGTFFKPKNDLFGQFWDPLDFRAEGPKKNIFGDFTDFFAKKN